MQEDEAGILFFTALLIPVIYVLIHALYTRVQARMHEFMLTLVVSTLPFGIILNLMEAARELRTRVHWEKWILFALFPTLIIFGCSIWALSAAKRLNEQRAWHRLGIILIGWTAFPFLALPIFIGSAYGTSFRALDFSIRAAIVVVTFVLSLSPIIIALRIERKCASKEMKSAILP